MERAVQMDLWRRKNSTQHPPLCFAFLPPPDSQGLGRVSPFPLESLPRLPLRSASTCDGDSALWRDPEVYIAICYLREAFISNTWRKFWLTSFLAPSQRNASCSYNSPRILPWWNVWFDSKPDLGIHAAKFPLSSHYIIYIIVAYAFPLQSRTPSVPIYSSWF